MATFLLTWNPDDESGWPEANYLAAVAVTQKGKRHKGSWSTGNRTSLIAPGDRCFLVRQRHERGIVASGHFTSDVWHGQHWREKGKTANYADIEWDAVLPISQRLAVETLNAKVPDVQWDRLQGSGVLALSPADSQLERLWSPLSGAQPRGGSPAKATKTKSQGWQSDPLRRAAVERHAQQMLEDRYRNDGWKVLDTSATKPYDAVATKGKKTLYLEAKGTESDGNSVLVTAGEVRHARKYPGQCVIGIVSAVVFLKDGSLDPTSGRLDVYEWDPDTGTLTPTTFRWTI